MRADDASSASACLKCLNPADNPTNPTSLTSLAIPTDLSPLPVVFHPNNRPTVCHTLPTPFRRAHVGHDFPRVNTSFDSCSYDSWRARIRIRISVDGAQHGVHMAHTWCAWETRMIQSLCVTLYLRLRTRLTVCALCTAQSGLSGLPACSAAAWPTRLTRFSNHA